MAIKHNKKWSRKKILRRIRHLHENGMVMAPGEVKMRESSLFSTAVSKRYFGSWRCALSEAGINPVSEYRRYRDKLNMDCKWNRDTVLGKIEEMDYDDLLQAHVKHHLVYSAARYYFGTWKKALEEAGKLKEMENMKKKQLVMEVKQYVEKHGNTGVTSMDPALYNRVYRMFGSWDCAVMETGRSDEK